MNNQHRIGKIFGRLTALTQIGSYHKCRCSCNTIVTIRTDRLSSGKTKSCGCLAKEITDVMHAEAVARKAEMRRIKKLSKPPERSAEETKLRAVWGAMMHRCSNPKNSDYHRYGGRGIRVCARWTSVSNFLEDLTPIYKKGRWLERIDNDEGYTPENCTFATPRNQATNRSNTLRLWHTRLGREVPLVNQCRLRGVEYNKAYKWFSAIVSQDLTPTVEEFIDEFVPE